MDFAKPQLYSWSLTSKLILFLPIILISWVVLSFNSVSVKAVDIHQKPQDFCYSDKNCSSNTWAGQCHDGRQQSPINIQLKPESKKSPRNIHLRLHHFRSDHFFMQNNGHTINLDFAQIDDDAYIFPGFGLTTTKYRFANAHFHWGTKDAFGSEHNVEGQSFSMELHLVHYNQRYPTMTEAVLSGDTNALAVVAIFLQADNNTKPSPALEPIVKNLPKIHHKHTLWLKVESPLDLQPLMPEHTAMLYSYKGSLTTPGCNEQVNWFVFHNPIKIAPSDVKAFRDVVDGKGKAITENNRPIQKRNGRNIQYLMLNIDPDT